MTICELIPTIYPNPPSSAGPVLYVVTAEKPNGRTYDYRTFNPEWAITAQQGYEYRRGDVARVEVENAI